jgi:hypothetical protein
VETDSNKNKVRSILEQDNRGREETIREIVAKSRLTFYTGFKIIKLVLRFTLKCAKLIPRVLTEKHKRKRKNAARENIFLHNLGPEFFEGYIATGNETWVHTPENKRQSQQWLPAWMPRPQKSIRKLSRKKVLATFFWDNIGILLVDFLQKGRAITGEYYAKLLEKLLRRIRRKRENMEEEGMFFLHDSATPHTSKISTEGICRLGFIPLFHLPYGPDLVPSELCCEAYYLFPKLKHLASKKCSYQ